MKELAAAIALLCLSTNALAHDIYSNLRDRDGHLCCGGQDCRPVEAVVLPDGNYYLPASGEIIPAEMATPSPDDCFEGEELNVDTNHHHDHFQRGAFRCQLINCLFGFYRSVEM